MGIVKVDFLGAASKLKKMQVDLEDKILKSFIECGEQCVQDMRINKTYTDRTGNLTASMGYGVIKKRNLVYIGGFKDGEGRENGISLLAEVAQTIQSEYSVIIVVGMEYAVKVERNGDNVISHTRLNFENLVRDAYDKR